MADQQQKWVLKREVSVGDIVAFTAAFVSVVYAWATLDKRLTIMEEKHATIVRAMYEQGNDVNQLKRDIKEDLQRINDKLDRLMYRK